MQSTSVSWSCRYLCVRNAAHVGAKLIWKAVFLHVRMSWLVKSQRVTVSQSYLGVASDNSGVKGPKKTFTVPYRNMQVNGKPPVAVCGTASEPNHSTLAPWVGVFTGSTVISSCQHHVLMCNIFPSMCNIVSPIYLCHYGHNCFLFLF